MKDAVPQRILGFDMDGVIIDHTSYKTASLTDLGIAFSPTDMPAEKIKKLLTPEQKQTMSHNMYDLPEVALKAPLMAGALEGLTQVAASGVPYYLISLRKNPEIAIELLKRCGLWGEVFHDDNVFFVGEIADKERVASHLGVTHYVDDQVRVLEAIISVKNRFLFDTFNAYPDDSLYTRVASWKEVVDYYLGE